MQNIGAGNGDRHNKYTNGLIFIISLWLLISNLYSGELMAQDEKPPAGTKKDSLKPHSPHKATIYSLILPGLGQVYNKKYWKVPVIYAGFGVLGYFIKTNTDEYHKFRDAYKYVVNEETGPIDNPYVDRYEEDALKRGRDYYRRNMEVNYIFTTFWYIINVLDATVDAHFYDYNVNDNLSLELGPAINREWYGNRQYGGVSLTLKIKQ